MDGFLAQIQGKGTFAKVGTDHVAKLVLRPKAPCLLAHVLDQLGPLNALGKSREIFHQGGKRQLASGFMTFEHQRFQVGTGRVERRSVTGAARPDNDDVANVLHKFRSNDASELRWPDSDLDASVALRHRYFFFTAGFFAEDGFGLASATPPSRANSSGTVVLACSRPR